MFIQRKTGGESPNCANLKDYNGGSKPNVRVVMTLWSARFVSSQADVTWSVNGVPKGTIKQTLGHLPIMVKSKLCNLYGMSPKELVEHHEEAEVIHMSSHVT